MRRGGRPPSAVIRPKLAAAGEEELFHRSGETISRTVNCAKCRKCRAPADANSSPHSVSVRTESALTKETLSNLLQESRRFDPPPELAAHANVPAGVYAEAARDRLAFWEDKARRLTWDEPWDQVLNWSRAP